MKKFSILFLTAIACLFVVSSCSRQEPVPTGPVQPTIVAVQINEVYARGTAANPDWIEIYNPNASSVDMSGYKVYALAGKNGTKTKKALPAGTTIAAKGYMAVVVNDTVSATGFDLSAAGETVWLENAAGSVIDNVLYPSLGVDSSYARKPDGAATWAVVTPPTRAGANSILPVVVNEVFSRGVPGDLDWMEVYNPNSIPVDISGYKVYDGGGQTGAKPKKEFPAGTVLAPKGFAAITCDTTDASGFGISSSGEDLWLENATGNVIDKVTMIAIPVATNSYGRNPDGSATWQILTTTTRGLPNKP